jgi:hypothetical protein
MNLEKIEIHIRNWLVIGFLGLLLIVSIVLVSDLIGNVFKLNPSWDVLAFSGAIIGGGLTLVGVRYTLKEQHKKEFIEKYPEKMGIVDELLVYMSEIKDICERYVSGEYKYELVVAFISVHNRYEQNLIAATKVNSNVYYLVRNFKMLLLSIDGVFNSEKDFETKETLIKAYINNIDGYFSSMFSELDKLQKTYHGQYER